MESTFGNSRPVALVVGSDGQFAIKLVELFVEVDAYLLQTLIGSYRITCGQGGSTAKASAIYHHHLFLLVDTHRW